MRTVQQYYDDNRDKILFDVRALEEYEKETIEASIHYYWEDMIKVLEDNKEEFEAKYSKDTPIYILLSLPIYCSCHVFQSKLSSKLPFCLQKFLLH